MLMNDFGGQLKKIRTQKGFSQEVFAKKIEVHVTNLSKYERNISIPSLEIAQRMAENLEISLDELVYGNNRAENTIKDTDLLNLFNKTQKLNDNQKSTVKDLLDAFLLKTNLKQQLA